VDSEVYVVTHKFEIKNAAGVMGEFQVCFKLDYNFKMMLIEEEESNTISVSPPKLDWWIETFGVVENNNGK